MPALEKAFLETLFRVLNPRDLVEPGILAYSKLRYDCYLSIRESHAVADVIASVAKDAALLRASSITKLKASAIQNDPEACLELALRTFTGCGTYKDEDAAMLLWRRLADPALPDHIPNVPRSIRARAYACLAFVHCERRLVDETNIKWIKYTLYRAGEAADACTALGFMTPAILRIGAAIEHARFRSEEPQYRRFMQLENLWEAFDKATAAYEASLNKQDANSEAEKNASARLCAAPRCGIETTSKYALMRCSGPCAPEAKPSYCSKECQIRDWKRHKSACKPSVAPKSPEE